MDTCSMETMDPKELTAFQRDLLRVVAESGPCSGTTIRDEIQRKYSSEINHGRLYPNLDKLSDDGYIVKREEEPDRRTNTYHLSGKGISTLRDLAEWDSDSVEHAEELVESGVIRSDD